MLKPKSKGLYIDISEFSIIAARTSGYKTPMVVEELAEFPLGSEVDALDVRAFFEQIVDFKGNAYYQSCCAVYPAGRFVRYYEAESANKLKDPKFIAKILLSEFNIDLEQSYVSVLNASDGSDLDLANNRAKKLIFCGAPQDAFQAEQDRMLEYGIYPDRLELSTISTVGGLNDYINFEGLKGPVLCFELTSDSANITIINKGQVEVARPIPFGLDSIYPLLQRELGLKDEASAKKLFFSNTFDFAEMGPKLLRRMTKELQASTGFYEVQTGQTIEHVFLSVLPSNLNWVTKTVSDSLGLEVVQPRFESWLETRDIQLADGVEVVSLGPRWLSLFSMMGEYQLREVAASE